MARGKGGSGEVWRVKEGFALPDEGFLRAYAPGQLLRGDDPVVKSHAQFLEPASNAVVESMTAEPGERRTLRLPQGTTVEGATAHETGHAHTGTPRGRRADTVSPHRDRNVKPGDPESPASEFAPAQPAAGVVAPDVTEDQNPAGAPQTDAAGTLPDGVKLPVAEGSYDPDDHTVPEVNAYLDTVSDEERERILQAERDGQNRTGIVG